MVTCWPGERVEITARYFTQRGAWRVAALANKHAYQQRSREVIRVEPTDWAPLSSRRERVVKVLEDWGSAMTPDALASFTAMSPRAVEEVLLGLGRDRRAVFRVMGQGEGVWRLRTRQERDADQRI